MRVPDPTGVLESHGQDPRILVEGSPSDFGGTYYHLYPRRDHPEGYDGVHVQPAEGKWNLDFNRNYPLGWFPGEPPARRRQIPFEQPGKQSSGGFCPSHPNICGGVTYHTSGGCYIYPPGTKPEKQADSRDMRMFKEIGAMATEGDRLRLLQHL